MQSAWSESPPPLESSPLFSVEFTFPAQDFQTDWKQCSLLANYIAAYTAYQFQQQERAENIISTIANELLEAVVYLAPPHSDLSIQVAQQESGLQLRSSHLIRTELVAAYTTFLTNLAPGPADQSYLNLLITPKTPAHYFNQLGLMMVSHDFGAQLTRLPLSSPERFCTQLFIPNKEFQT